MKILSILCLILLLSGMVSCTPVALTEENQVPAAFDTGDDDSVRPDHDKDD